MKIWSKMFLVAATGMMMFSSCLETIEPEGLNDLRGAKADLLRAETALVEAKAARENAEAAFKLAEAKIKEAIAKQEEARVAYFEAEALLKKYQAEYQALVNAAYEAEQAELLKQKMIETEKLRNEAENKAKEAAAMLERDLLQIQTQIVNAQAAYETALKNLLLAQNGLTAEQKEYVASYQSDVDFWQKEVNRYAAELAEYEYALEVALTEFDENKASAMVLRQYEKKVIDLEAKVAGIEEVIAILEAAMTLDPQATDWAEELAELEAEKEAMELEHEAAKTEKVKEAEEWKEAIDELTAAYEEYEAATGYAFNEYTGEFSVIPGDKTPLPYYDIYVPSPKDEGGDNLFGEEYGDFIVYGAAVQKKEDNGEPVYKDGKPVMVANPNEETEYFYGDPSEVLKAFDKAIENYEKASSTKSYDLMNMIYDAKLKVIEELEENVALLEKYNDAVAAYKTGDVATYKAKYFTSDDPDAEYDVETAVEEYNAALKEMVAALKTLNDAQKTYAKSDVDEDPEVIAALEKKTADDNASDAKYYSGLQSEYDKYNAAREVFDAAYYAYSRAKATYDATIAAAIAAVTSEELGDYALTVDENAEYTTLENAIKTAIETYETAAKAEDFEDEDGSYEAAYDVFVDQLTEIEDAQKAFNSTTNKEDATDKWEAAKKAYGEYGGSVDATPGNSDFDSVDERTGTYQTNVAELFDTWDAEKTAHKKAYDELLEDKGIQYTGMDEEYEDYITGLYTAAAGKLHNAIGAVEDYAVREYEDAEVVMGEEGFTQFGGDDNTGWVANDEYPTYPDYLVDAEAQTLKEIKVTDLFDVEYFKATEITTLADQYAAYAKVTYNEDKTYFVVLARPADYPMTLPTAKAVAEAALELDEMEDSKEEEYLAAVATEELVKAGVVIDVDVEFKEFYESVIANIAKVENKVAENEAAKANTAVAAAHIPVLEAAKAEFEEWAEAEDARIDALGAAVVAEWNEVYPQLNAAMDEMKAYKETINEIGTAITNLKALINKYVKVEVPVWDGSEYTITAKNPSEGDIEAFVEELEYMYEGATKDLADAEAELADAVTALEKAKAGEYSDSYAPTDDNGVPMDGYWYAENVKTAEANYNHAVVKLQYAMERLDEAAQALQDALIAIGAVEPEAEEDAPATEDTPATDETPAE